jgi:hypothetical protein
LIAPTRQNRRVRPRFLSIGRLSAKYVQRGLLRANPGEAVERVDRLHFTINLKTAKALELAISAPVLARADEIIQ